MSLRRFGGEEFGVADHRRTTASLRYSQNADLQEVYDLKNPAYV